MTMAIRISILAGLAAVSMLPLTNASFAQNFQGFGAPASVIEQATSQRAVQEKPVRLIKRKPRRAD